MLTKNPNLEHALSSMASSSTAKRKKWEEKRGNLRTNPNKGLLFGSDIKSNYRCHKQRYLPILSPIVAVMDSRILQSNCRSWTIFVFILVSKLI